MYWSVGGQYDIGNISVGAGETAVTITGRTTYLTYDVTIVAFSDHLPSPVAVVMITLGEPVNVSCMYHIDVCHILKFTLLWHVLYAESLLQSEESLQLDPVDSSVPNQATLAVHNE